MGGQYLLQPPDEEKETTGSLCFRGSPGLSFVSCASKRCFLSSFRHPSCLSLACSLSNPVAIPLPAQGVLPLSEINGAILTIKPRCFTRGWKTERERERLYRVREWYARKHLPMGNISAVGCLFHRDKITCRTYIYSWVSEYRVATNRESTLLPYWTRSMKL